MWTDVVTGPDGHAVLGYVSVPHVKIVNSVDIAVGDALRWVRIAVTPEWRIAAAGQPQHFPGIILATATRRRHIVGDQWGPITANGAQPCGLVAQGETFVLVWCDIKHWKRLRVNATDLVNIGPVERFPITTSQGMLDVRPDLTPVLTDSHRATVVTDRYGHDWRLTLPMTRGYLTAGEANEGGPGVLVFDRATHIMYRAHSGQSIAPPRLALDGDGAIVAVTPSTFIRSADWLEARRDPAPQPTPDPDPPLATVHRPFLFGPIAAMSGEAASLALRPGGHDPSAPGNVEVPIWPSPAQLQQATRPVIQHAPRAHQAPSGLRYGVYVHLAGNLSSGGIRAALTEGRDEADALGLGLVVYDDRRGFRLDQIGPRLRRGDILSPQWYTTDAESLNSFDDACRAELDRLAPDWPVCPTIACYERAGRLTEAHLEDAVRRLFRLASERSDLFGYLYFSWLRADGVYGTARYLTPMLTQFARAIPGRPAPPRPVPPQVDPPDPSVPVPVVPARLPWEFFHAAHRR